MSEGFISKFEAYNFDHATEALLELQDEMRNKAAEVFSLYFDSVAGSEMLTRHLSDWKAEHTRKMKETGVDVANETWMTLDELFVDPPPHGHKSNFGDFARTLADYRDRLLPDGRNTQLIGNFLLIALYQYWEDSWRGRIAEALKFKNKDLIKSDFWGDLRLIRHCLIHKKGIADNDVVSKTKRFKWFKEGDTILIDRQRAEAIISGLFFFLHSELLEYKLNGSELSE